MKDDTQFYVEKDIISIQHPQEKIIKTYDHNGITVDLIEWSDTVWCGKIGYADNNTD